MKRIKTEFTQNREFGKRLALIRKSKGFTQRDIAKELGISNRMVAYYETQTDIPPAALLPQLSKILNITTDVLLGLKPIKDLPSNYKLHRKLKKIEKLSPADQKKVIEYAKILKKAEQNN